MPSELLFEFAFQDFCKLNCFKKNFWEKVHYGDQF